MEEEKELFLINKKLDRISKQNKLLMWGLIAVIVYPLYTQYSTLMDYIETEIFEVTESEKTEIIQEFILDNVNFFLIMIAVGIVLYLVNDVSSKFIIPWIKNIRN